MKVYLSSLYIDIGKHAKGLQIKRKHCSCTSFSVKWDRKRFKSIFMHVHSIKNINSEWTQLHDSSKIQLEACAWEWPTYMPRLWKWQDCMLGYKNYKACFFNTITKIERGANWYPLVPWITRGIGQPRSDLSHRSEKDSIWWDKPRSGKLYKCAIEG